jgi:hypothetical protein
MGGSRGLALIQNAVEVAKLYLSNSPKPARVAQTNLPTERGFYARTAGA